MKYTVKNNSSAPHDLMTIKGRVVVLAGGSVDVELAPEIVPVYGAVPFFEVKRGGHEGGMVKDGPHVIGERGPEFVIPAPSADNNEPIRRKPGRPPKAA